jgi:hypothetical protein
MESAGWAAKGVTDCPVDMPNGGVRRMHGRTSRGAPRGKLKRAFRALLQQSRPSMILENLGITDITPQGID